jgi:hypothetical protein
MLSFVLANTPRPSILSPNVPVAFGIIVHYDYSILMRPLETESSLMRYLIAALHPSLKCLWRPT